MSENLLKQLVLFNLDYFELVYILHIGCKLKIYLICSIIRMAVKMVAILGLGYMKVRFI